MSAQTREADAELAVRVDVEELVCLLACQSLSEIERLGQVTSDLGGNLLPLVQEALPQHSLIGELDPVRMQVACT